MTDSGEIPDDTVEILSAGARLGKYQIVRLLGAGGMGAVYEASHTEIGKRVAIKVLGPSIAAIPGARARFLREAQLTSQVRHPNIVDVTDMGNEGGQAFLVMEFLQGEDLSQRLGRVGQMSPVELVEVMLPVCSAVAAAHQAGITHRDLKPQNIFLAAGPHGLLPKVLDFGISKGADKASASNLTGTGTMIGTPFYLAPEQILDGKSAGPGSDQYALGVILYECLTGRRPFEAENLFVVFQAIVAGSPPPPRQVRPDLPPALEQVVIRAMNVEARQRYSSVNALGRALLPFASARARLLWNEAFPGVDDPMPEVAPFVGEPGATAQMPVVAAAAAILPTTAKVAARGGRAAPREGARPSGSGTVDVMSPALGSGNLKKVGAVAVGVVAAIGVVVWLTGSKDSGSGHGAGGTVSVTDVPPAPARRSDSPAITTPPRPSEPSAPSAQAEPVAPTVVPPPPPPEPSAPPVAEAPEPYVVLVTTDPGGAWLELDGERVGRGRLRRTLPSDHQRHILRVTADGFEPRVVEFTDSAPPRTIALTASSPAPRDDTADTDSAAGTPPAVPGRRTSPPRSPRRNRDTDSDRPAPPLPSLNPNGAPVID